MKLVGERRALAATVLVFFGLFYSAMAALGFAGAAENAMFALASCYGLAFFGLVAGYFWARWFAIGLAGFGIIQGAVSWWVAGPETMVLFIGGSHLFVVAALWGEAMAGPFEGQAQWREKFHMDDNAVHRLGRSVMRAGLSLPFVLLYAFAPKPDPESVVGSIVALGLFAVGMRGLVQLKTWGVLALGGAAMILATIAGVHMLEGWVPMAPAVGSLLLFSATAPFAAPIARALARRTV